MAEAPWGEVPEHVRTLIETFRETIAAHEKKLNEVQWPASTGDISLALLGTLAETESIHQASKDLRSLLTAYAHQVHQPRPKMASVARAQRATPQAVTSRYTAKTTAALALLIDPAADLSELLRSEVVLSAFPSLAQTKNVVADYVQSDTTVVLTPGGSEL